MASSFVSYWNYGKKYCGIEYRSSLNEGLNFSILSAIKKKGEFEIETSFQATDPEKCARKLPKNQHAYLCITGNNVLLKSTEMTGPDVKVVSAAFPNLDLNDFYFEILPASIGSIVALCRREQVHHIIASFAEQNIRVVGFSLGFASVQNLLGIIKQNEIFLSTYSIIIKEKKIVSFKKEEKEQAEANYTIGDTNISSRFLLSLSAIFNYSGGTIYSQSNFDEKNLQLKKEHHQKIFFRKGLATAVVLLLSMLLINFLIFSSYYAELQQMSGRHSVEISQKQAYDRKFLELNEKEKIMENIFNNSNSRSSFFLNRLINEKPSSVLLNEYTYQPLQKKIKDKEPISLETNLIRIAGESKNEEDFSNWIKNLEKNPWIVEVKVSDFGYSSPGISEFHLTLKLNDDETIN